MKKVITQSIIFIAFIWSASAHAVWYQVELIVFENLYPESDGELWYQTPRLIDLDDTVILKSYHESLAMRSEEGDISSQGDSPLVPYSILPEDNYRLDGIYRVLRLSREYRPLYHISWQQPGLDGDQSKPVHLQANDVSNLYELTIPASLVTEPMPENFYEPVELSIDGSLRIRSSLYLYVDLDMVLFRQAPEQESESNGSIKTIEQTLQQMSEIDPVEYVRLVETRRIKLNELHYFDHPMFGIIIQISRYGP